MQIDMTGIEFEDIKDNLCACGCKLTYHGFVMLWTINTLHVSQCTKCDCSVYREDEDDS